MSWGKPMQKLECWEGARPGGLSKVSSLRNFPSVCSNFATNPSSRRLKTIRADTR